MLASYMTLCNWIVLLCIITPILCYAHEPDQAFFNIKEGKEDVEVVAELPWSIRNALLKEYPELQQSQEKKDFEDAFKNYVKKNFKIYNQSNNLFELVQVLEIPNEKHAHASKYRFIFEGSGIRRIQNTILMNIYARQQNHHTISSSKHTFITTKENDTYQFDSNNFYLIIRIFLVLLVIVVSLVVAILRLQR